jgi:hypothetical protein
MSENVCICCSLRILDFGIMFSFIPKFKIPITSGLVKLTPVDFSSLQYIHLHLLLKLTGVKALLGG